jgi:hypothetical protein
LGVAVISQQGAWASVCNSLGLTDTAEEVQVLAGALRRTASLRCPVAPSVLVASVIDVLAPLGLSDSDLATGVLDSLVAAGDLVEAIEDVDGRRRRLIYLGPPRFIRRPSGDILLFGTRPDGHPLVGESLADRLDGERHVRRLPQPDEADLELLAAYGLAEITESKWMAQPDVCEPGELVAHYDDRLHRQSSSGDIDGLRVVDPGADPGYYRGRWRLPRPSDSGQFVARRSQGYGADLWCYVELSGGAHRRLLDLPLYLRDRGCDEAWRLQAAIDAQGGHPQRVTVRRTGAGRLCLGVSSPLPRWLQRRWDLLGSPTRSKGSLFAYEFGAADARDELAGLASHLWMRAEVVEEGTQA